jgi:uncharacterized protein DUF29
MEDPAALYERDFHAWSLHQARVLRGLAAGGLALPNSLDLEHVAEEIEDLGNEQRFAVESSLAQALVHLIKIVALPGDPAVRHWMKEVNAFLDAAEGRYCPSMRRAIADERLWARARRRAAQDFEIDGHPVPMLPADPPFALEELVGEDADPRDLSARLAAAVAALGPPPPGAD